MNSARNALVGGTEALLAPGWLHDTMGPSLETTSHSRLKLLSLAWLQRQGYAAAAREVRSPIAQWILDVAGWRDSRVSSDAGTRVRLHVPSTVIVECKQSRSDFLRDSRRLDQLLELRQRYTRIRRSIEENRIKENEPQLRQTGSALFTELEEWDFSASCHRPYHRTLQKLEQLDFRVHSETKFFRIAQYRLADALYIAAPAGMIRPRELPAGWGLVQFDPASLCAMHVAELGTLPVEPVDVWNEVPGSMSSPKHRQALLRNIAIAASSQAARALSKVTKTSNLR